MQHVSPERLAALLDEAPTATEAEHLAACAECAGERASVERLVAMAAEERLRIAPPLTTWESLSARMREERRAERVRRTLWKVAGQAAAVLLLVAGGVAAGRMSAGAPALPASIAAAVGLDTATDAPNYATAEEALEALSISQREYQRAAAFLAAHDTAARGEDALQLYRARLAALDDNMSRWRDALYEAPADPVINQQYLYSLGLREATLRQLGAVLPTGSRLARF